MQLMLPFDKLEKVDQDVSYEEKKNLFDILFCYSYKMKIIISNCSCNSAHLHADDNDNLQNEQDIVSI
jgi:hypothetical protein